MTKYAQKPDRSLPAIREALDAAGVRYILAPSGLVCDIIALWDGRVYFLEVKNPGERVRLTPKETALLDLVGESNFLIVRTPDDVISKMGLEQI